VASVLIDTSRDLRVRRLLVFTGDRDFADTVRRAIAGRPASCPLEVRFLTFYAPVHEDLLKAAGGTHPLIDVSEAYRVRIGGSDAGASK
jgi:hypothetical protein